MAVFRFKEKGPLRALGVTIAASIGETDQTFG